MPQMQPTLFQTYTLPGVTAGADPLGIARAPLDRPARALVRNIGAAIVFLAGSREDALNPSGVASSTFQLFPDTSEVFVLAPGQVLYGTGAGVGATASVSLSDAIPIGFEEAPRSS